MAESSGMSPQLNTKKRSRFFGGAANKEKQMNLTVAAPPTAPEQIEAVALLGKIFGDRVSRNRLISTAAKWELSPNPLNSIRFCIAVDEYDKIQDKVEKKSRARKIVSMFIQSGSMFQLPNGVPKEFEKGLAAEKFDNLLKLRSAHINEIASSESIMDRIKALDL